MKRSIVKCLYERTKHLTTKPSVISEEKKHLSSVLVSKGYPSSFPRTLAKKTRVTANKETVQEFKSTAVLLNIKGCIRGSSPLPTTSRHTVFEFETTLRSHLVRPKDALELTKQNGFVCKIPCECRTWLTQFARTQTSAVSEHANETGHIPIWSKVKFIDRDPHWYTRRVKEAIHIRFHPCNINRDSGIEIPEAWIPTIQAVCALRLHCIVVASFWIWRWKRQKSTDFDWIFRKK